MKTKTLLSIAMVMMMAGAYAQKPTMTLTFTADNNGDYITLDSIKIMNRTQGGETMIYWPDTIVSLEIMPGDLLLFVGYTTFSTVSITELNDDNSSFSVYQNYPNPMVNQGEISIYIPHAGKVNLMITDLQGSVVLRTDRQLEEGFHTFMFHPGSSNFYFLTAHWNGISRSIKMISTGKGNGILNRLEYIGSGAGESVLKASVQYDDFIVFESGILDAPEQNTTYTFQFATNIPCQGMPTVDYEGQVYNTIQIFSQCWLKENLNVGTMIIGSQNQTDNGLIEKYCYDNNPINCENFGGLYQWNEMMGYITTPGVQGICPPGWHIPTEDEWEILEGTVDSQYGVGDPIWDDDWYRGFDAGKNLKSTSGWDSGGNGTDLYGFGGLPGGRRFTNGSFNYLGAEGYWWSSSEESGSSAWSRYLRSDNDGSYRDGYSKANGFSVRCLKY